MCTADVYAEYGCGLISWKYTLKRRLAPGGRDKEIGEVRGGREQRVGATVLDRATIEWIEIYDKSDRCHGYGACLLTLALQELRSDDASAVDLRVRTDAPAWLARWYQRRGFVHPPDREAGQDDDDSFTADLRANLTNMSSCCLNVGRTL